MGWLGTNLKRLREAIKGEAPVAFTYVPSIPTHDVPNVGEDIVPDECYLTLYIESLRLERARRFGTTFTGLAYSMVTLARQGQPNASLTAVSKPAQLAELDPKGIGRVITVSKEMMAPTAYRGGPVSLELGLFSVKAGDLLSPILDYVVKVSTTAGISSVNAVKPFIPLVIEGMDLIAGSGRETVLEVGLDTDVDLRKSCVSAIIARDRTAIDPSQLELAANGTLMHGGAPLDCGYVTFSLRRTVQKADYGAIAELEDRFAHLVGAVRLGNERDARDALTAFRLTAITSPDLITADAKKLVDQATRMVNDAFSPPVAAGPFPLAGTERTLPTSLYDMKLYD